ncbi:MAG TPA: sensor domain-containing diguanylate cyclase [Lachnospiraceae bacterium]|nr:sensor domain-containing diguanylate cyclase [Lachnospiraceae bacterium]
MRDEKSFLYDTISAGVMKLHLKNPIDIIEANDFFYSMFGTQAGDYNRGAFTRFGETDRLMYESYIRQRGIDKENIYIEFKSTHQSTEKEIWVRMEARFLEEKDGAPIYLAVLTDITVQKQLKHELEEIHNLYLKAISSGDEMIFDYQVMEDCFIYYSLVDVNGTIINRPTTREKFLENLGQERDIHPDDLVYFYDLCRENITHPFDIRFRRQGQKPGEYSLMRVHASVQKDSKKRPCRIIGTIRPIETIRYERDKGDIYLKQDELTGLNSRGMAKKLIEDYKANSSVSFPYALLILDIKDFKRVNDVFGHMFGDNVLIQVADTIIENVNKADIVGRLGGDEFLIFLKNVSEASVVGMSDRLSRAIRDIYVGENLQIDACIGAVVSQDPTIAYNDLLQTADNALFEMITEEKTGVLIAKDIITHAKGLKISYVADRNIRSNPEMKEKRLSELIFELLEQAKDIDKAIYTVLALVGEKKNLSRIVMMRKNGIHLEVTYQWTARGIEGNQQIAGKEFFDYQKSMEKNFTEDGMGIIDRASIRRYHPELEPALLPADAKSLMYCNMLEFGEVCGVITFIDCKEDRAWEDKDFKAFRSVTRMISAYTVKAQALKKEAKEVDMEA